MPSGRVVDWVNTGCPLPGQQGTLFNKELLCLDILSCLSICLPMANTQRAGKEAYGLLITPLNLLHNQIYDTMNNAIASMFYFIEK